MDITETVKGGVSKVDRYGWTRHGDQGESVMINKRELQVDHTYQRDGISHAKILEIAKNWNPVASGVLIVSLRPNGEMYIIDGQHRWMASMKRSDVTHLNCRVFEFESVMDEAEAFLVLNQNRASVGSYHKHKAGLVSGNETAIAVQRMADESGRDVVNGGGRARNTVCCVSVIASLYDKNPSICRKSYMLVHEMCEDTILDAEILKGVFAYEMFLQRVGSSESVFHIDNRRKLISFGATQAKQYIKAAKNDHGKGGDRVSAIGIARLLNHKKRNRLPVPA